LSDYRNPGTVFSKNHYNVINYKINDIARSSVIAPFDFPILKSDKELESDRLEAIKKVPFIFLQDKAVEETQIQQIQKLFLEYRSLRAARLKYDDTGGITITN
jgi:membrane-associated HD superfamily phosphohydrolase